MFALCPQSACMLAIGDWFWGQHLTRAKANGLLSRRLWLKEMKARELWAVDAFFFLDAEKNEAEKTL